MIQYSEIFIGVEVLARACKDLVDLSVWGCSVYPAEMSRCARGRCTVTRCYNPVMVYLKQIKLLWVYTTA